MDAIPVNLDLDKDALKVVLESRFPSCDVTIVSDSVFHQEENERRYLVAFHTDSGMHLYEHKWCVTVNRTGMHIQ